MYSTNSVSDADTNNKCRQHTTGWTMVGVWSAEECKRRQMRMKADRRGHEWGWASKGRSGTGTWQQQHWQQLHSSYNHSTTHQYPLPKNQPTRILLAKTEPPQLSFWFFGPNHPSCMPLNCNPLSHQIWCPLPLGPLYPKTSPLTIFWLKLSPCCSVLGFLPTTPPPLSHITELHPKGAQMQPGKCAQIRAGECKWEWASANQGGEAMAAAGAVPSPPFIYLFSFSLSEMAAVSPPLPILHFNI